MTAKGLNFNNEIIDVNELEQKVTDDVKKNVIRFEISGGNIQRLASGFLCKIYVNNMPIPVLITCYHVLNEEFFKRFKFLYFSYFSGKEKKEILLDLNIQRIIYLNKEFDATIIEIKETDNLDIYSFLEMEKSIDFQNLLLQDEKIYLLHFPKGAQHIHFSKGIIIDITDNNKNFTANYSSEPGSSGCPIINYENNLVIGIHKGSIKGLDKKIGFGIILKNVIEIFSKEKYKDIIKGYNNLYSPINTMDMIYIIPDDNKPIRLFGGEFAEFVNRNKDVCKLIYNGMEFPLTQNFNRSYLTNEDKKKKEFKITLKGIKYVKNMNLMFSRCYCLKKVFATRTDFSKVENMDAMFEWCHNLEEISDTSLWNLENVKTLKGLFYKCVALKSIPGMNKWNPKKLETCEEMFFGCYKNLKPSETSKIYEWKNVPENIKSKSMQGFSIGNIVTHWSYAIFDNLPGTMNWIKNIGFKNE